MEVPAKPTELKHLSYECVEGCCGAKVLLDFPLPDPENPQWEMDMDDAEFAGNDEDLWLSVRDYVSEDQVKEAQKIVEHDLKVIINNDYIKTIYSSMSTKYGTSVYLNDLQRSMFEELLLKYGFKFVSEWQNPSQGHAHHKVSLFFLNKK